MKTTRRGLFGMLAGIAGTLALGKGAAKTAPVAALGKGQSPPSAAFPVVMHPYAIAEYRDAWGVEIRATASTGTEVASREVPAQVRVGPKSVRKGALVVYTDDGWQEAAPRNYNAVDIEALG